MSTAETSSMSCLWTFISELHTIIFQLLLGSWIWNL